MSAPINDGGPAFPLPADSYTWTPDEGAKVKEHVIKGMTLRDWFAGQALAALIKKTPLLCNKQHIGRQSTENEMQELREACCVSAYQYADAMLKAQEGAQ